MHALPITILVNTGMLVMPLNLMFGQLLTLFETQLQALI
jgi:hypothetical protein